MLTPSFSFEGGFGYDVTDKLGVFETIGVMQADYKREVSGSSSEAYYTGALYGFGVSYKIVDQLSLTAKYQVANLEGLDKAGHSF